MLCLLGHWGWTRETNLASSTCSLGSRHLWPMPLVPSSWLCKLDQTRSCNVEYSPCPTSNLEESETPSMEFEGNVLAPFKAPWWLLMTMKLHLFCYSGNSRVCLSLHQPGYMVAISFNSQSLLQGPVTKNHDSELSFLIKPIRKGNLVFFLFWEPDLRFYFLSSDIKYLICFLILLGHSFKRLSWVLEETLDFWTLFGLFYGGILKLEWMHFVFLNCF